MRQVPDGYTVWKQDKPRSRKGEVVWFASLDDAAPGDYIARDLVCKAEAVDACIHHQRRVA